MQFRIADLRSGLKDSIKNFKIEGFNDTSFGNLSDSYSQGVYIICLINEIGERSIKEIIKNG